VTDSLNHTTTVGFDPNGNVTDAKDPLNGETQATYQNNMPVTVTQVSGSGQNPTTQLAYDQHGVSLTEILATFRE
jgi:hypothetical protein